jgi:hypothetical protein
LGTKFGGTFMKKQLLITLVVAAMLLLYLSPASAIYNKPTEMLVWNPDKAQFGYNAFIAGGKAWLVDMEGQVINSWEGVDLEPDGYLFAMENGRWRVANETEDYGNTGILDEGGGLGRIEEYTWEGERFWWWDTMDGTISDGAGGYTNDDAASTFRGHHDWQRIYNKELKAWTYLTLVWVVKDKQDALNIGPVADTDQEFYAKADTGGTWTPCAIMEVLPLYDVTDNDPVNNDSAEIVWYWSFTDHLVTTDPQNTAVSAQWNDISGRINMPPVIVASDTDIQDHPELLDVTQRFLIDEFGTVPQKDWNHTNSFDYDENTGHIAINAKASSEFYVIDHDGTFVEGATRGTLANDWNTNEVAAEARTTAGDFLYRFGNPSYYNSGEEPSWFYQGDIEMYGAHDIQTIRDYHFRGPQAEAGDTWAAPTEDVALPGAGNFLIFDNGYHNPRNQGSYLLEINPYIYEASFSYGPKPGPYDPPPIIWDRTVGTKYADPATLPRRGQVVWSHGGGEDEINAFYSSFISSTARMPNGNTIADCGSWSHLVEFTEDGEVVWEYVIPPYEDGAFQPVLNHRKGIFRAHRFLPSHPALVGRDLTPKGTLTGRVPAELGSVAPASPAAPVAPTGWGTSGLSVGAGGGGGASGTDSTGGSAGY